MDARLLNRTRSATNRMYLCARAQKRHRRTMARTSRGPALTVVSGSRKACRPCRGTSRHRCASIPSARSSTLGWHCARGVADSDSGGGVRMCVCARAHTCTFVCARARSHAAGCRGSAKDGWGPTCRSFFANPASVQKASSSTCRATGGVRRSVVKILAETTIVVSKKPRKS